MGRVDNSVGGWPAAVMMVRRVSAVPRSLAAM